jgi:hypothetical protein
VNRKLEEAALALGAAPAEAAAVSGDDLAGITVPEAARLLGYESMRDRRARRYFAGPWRWALLARFGTKAGRGRLVALLERELTGEELRVPADVKEAVEHLLAADRQQRPDAPALFGNAALEYARLAGATN